MIVIFLFRVCVKLPNLINMKCVSWSRYVRVHTVSNTRTNTHTHLFVCIMWPSTGSGHKKSACKITHIPMLLYNDRHLLLLDPMRPMCKLIFTGFGTTHYDKMTKIHQR